MLLFKISTSQLTHSSDHYLPSAQLDNLLLTILYPRDSSDDSFGNQEPIITAIWLLWQNIIWRQPLLLIGLNSAAANEPAWAWTPQTSTFLESLQFKDDTFFWPLMQWCSSWWCRKASFLLGSIGRGKALLLVWWIGRALDDGLMTMPGSATNKPTWGWASEGGWVAE